MINAIKEFFVDFLVSVYSGFFTGVLDIYDLATSSPSSWNNGVLWKAVVDFNKSAVLPIAWSILGFFILIELAETMKRSDAKGLDGIYWITIVFIKIGIAKLIMDNMDIIIEAIFEISAAIVNNGSEFIRASSNKIAVDTSALADGFDNVNVIILIGYFVIGVILLLAQNICFVLTNLVIYLRFVEIYVFTALSALAFSTIPSREYSSIAKNFIKRMMALALQVVFIAIVLYCYLILINNATISVSVTDPMGGLFNGLTYSLLMVIALFQTGGWSKSLTQAS